VELSSTPAAVPILRIDPRIENEQIERVRAVRGGRDATLYAAALGRLEQAVRGRDNVLPLILDAVKAHATVGEIAGVMRAAWGEQRESGHGL
jgi:methylmalonyl-CoA mutase N-terminal domain/subunit